MATLDAGLLALIIFLALCICGLLFVGIYNVRRGLQRGSQDTSPTQWHKQPNVLFGLNNITFALLLLGILFLSLFTAPAIHYILFGLIGLLLIISIALVVRTMMASVAMVRKLQARSSQAKTKINEQRRS